MKKINNILLIVLFGLTVGLKLNAQDIAPFQNQIDKLNSTIQDKNEEIKNLNESIESLTTDITLSNENINPLKQKIEQIENNLVVLQDSIIILSNIEDKKIPVYKQEFLNKLQRIGQSIYVYLVIPIILILSFVVLSTYAYQNLWGDHKSDDRKIHFRRIATSSLPFVVSSYLVFLYYTNEFKFEYSNTGIFYTGDVFFLLGLILGFILFGTIAKISLDEENQIISATFFSSSILFSILTAFVVIQSLPIINIIYGFTIGAILYVVFFGFERIELILPKNIKGRQLGKKISNWRNIFKRKKTSGKQ